MAIQPYASRLETIWYYLERGVLGLVLAFLVLPILVVVPLSFSGGSMLVFPLPGLSFKWYEVLIADPQWITAAKNSFFIGGATMVLATLLGTLAALGLSNSSLRFKTVIMALIISPMIIPIVITAVATFFFYAMINLAGTYAGIIMAHTTLAVPFVVILVSATLQRYDNNLTRAATSLGASPFHAFSSVTLPIIMPGILSGSLFAFATSFDEIVVILFLSSPSQRTLPRQIFSGIRENIDPSIAAAAVVLIIVSGLLMTTVEVLRRRTERMRITVA